MVSRGCKKRDVFGVPGGVVLRAPEGPLFGVLAGLGVPKGCFWGPTIVVLGRFRGQNRTFTDPKKASF